MDMLHGVRWVLFDAVGTLIYAQPPVADTYWAAAWRFGSLVSIAEIQTRFCAALRAEHGTDSTGLERRPTSEAQEQERWRRIVAAVIDDVPSSEELFEQLWQHFARSESWGVYDDVIPALESLAGKGVRLGVASNFDARLHRVAAGLPELKRIEQIFVSSEVGYVKPDPRFFAAVQATLAIKPDEIFLVGDDEVNDIAGAVAAGWKSVLLDRGGDRSVPGAISSLQELF